MSTPIYPIEKQFDAINCTPHDITIYVGSVYNKKTHKSKGGQVLISIPPSGHLASTESDVEPAEPLMLNGTLIPTVNREYISCSPLPKDGRMYIVSTPYAAAAKELGLDLSNLLTTHGIVVDDSGKQIGCTQLVRYDQLAEVEASSDGFMEV